MCCRTWLKISQGVTPLDLFLFLNFSPTNDRDSKINTEKTENSVQYLSVGKSKPTVSLLVCNATREWKSATYKLLKILSFIRHGMSLKLQKTSLCPLMGMKIAPFLFHPRYNYRCIVPKSLCNFGASQLTDLAR